MRSRRGLSAACVLGGAGRGTLRAGGGIPAGAPRLRRAVLRRGDGRPAEAPGGGLRAGGRTGGLPGGAARRAGQGDAAPAGRGGGRRCGDPGRGRRTPGTQQHAGHLLPARPAPPEQRHDAGAGAAAGAVPRSESTSGASLRHGHAAGAVGGPGGGCPVRGS